MFNIPSFGLGFMVGFGAGFASREIVAIGTKTLKPVAKNVMKSGVQVIDKGREKIAYFGEALEDLFAEVKSENKLSQNSKTSKSKKRPMTSETTMATAQSAKA